MNAKQKKRLDALLMERGLFSSRTRCQEMISAGKVRVDGEICHKPGIKFSEDAAVVLDGEDFPYVSRGALKLAGAVEELGITLQGKNALDVGASTGGFSDFMLQQGLAHTFCVDVGSGQLHEKLRSHPRVSFWEAADIRKFSPDVLAAKIDIITVDVSFISLGKVLPVLAHFLTSGGELLALVKPQFELDRGSLDKHGVVKNPQLRELACANAVRFCEENGFRVLQVMPSRLKGGDGNQEYFMYAKKK